MKLLTLSTVAALAFLISQTTVVTAGTLTDITRPGDPLVIVNGFNQNDGNFGPPPAGEVESHAIDDIGQKYLNFLDIQSGFAVTPSANPDSLPVVGIRFYTANDAVERDPASFQLSGSNDSINGPWTYIASGNLALPEGRNAGGGAVVIPPTGNLGAVHQEVLFSNADSFEHYMVVFPTLKNAATANSMQIAEVEILADIIPEPSTSFMLGIGVVGLAVLRRRRK